MAGTVVDLTLEIIRDLLVEEVKFLSGVSSQVKDVQSELQRMQSFLEDVDRRKYEDRTVHNFAKEIRNLSYRIEDVVEEYAAEVVLRRRKKGLKKILNRLACIICECKNVHEVGSEITAIKTDLSNLLSSMEVYGVRTALERGKSDRQREAKKWLRQTYAHGVEEHFVGMQEDINLLVRILVSDERKHRIVSIYGMGGLGKSTLAKKIFHHEEIRREFKVFAWVCVSQDCKPKIVFQDLLKQLLPMNKPEEIMAMGENELVGEVYGVLKEQKCLVVLDDIWNVEDWKFLCPALPTVKTKSKVLITTRKESVAKVGFAHPLGLLSKDEGWELLQKKAFIFLDPKDISVEPEILEHLGWEMVHKCGYLPLAISVVGGILSTKNSLDAWETVSKNIDLYLSRGNGNEEEGAVKQVLSLSYDDLPHYLKPCFLHLSSFSEDETINSERLYLLWISEGIVSTKDQEKEETLMDVAQRYLGELANRSMVHVEVDNILASEKLKTCRLHDLLRDLCVAKSIEEEFLNLIDFQGGNPPSILSLSSASSLRRLAVFNVDQIPNSVSFKGESIQHLRFFLLHMPFTDPLENAPTLHDGVIDFKNFKFLRTLKFVNVNFKGKTLPEGLDNLIHLRMLGFSGCRLAELPSCVGDLPFLHTFDLGLSLLQTCKIPNVLWKLKRLKYLYLHPFWFTEGKLVLSSLDELEILYGFRTHYCEVIDLSKLKSLRRLGAEIYGNDNLSKFIDCIEVNRNFPLETKVELHGCDFCSEEGKILLRKIFLSHSIHDLYVDELHYTVDLPEYEQGFFSNLTRLYILGKEISEDPMVKVLEKLPKLRRLDISFSLFTGKDKEIVCHAGGFPELRYLKLNIVDLEKWTVEKGAMPFLLHLTLECKELETIPEGIRSTTTLQTLDITHMPKKFQKRALQGGEDFDKVRHVKNVQLTYI